MNKLELIQEVKNLVAEVNKTHRYSMSRIYGLWNNIFEKDEKPQSCASCLIRKVGDLKKWLEQESIVKDTEKEQPEKISKPQKRSKKKK